MRVLQSSDPFNRYMFPVDRLEKKLNASWTGEKVQFKDIKNSFEEPRSKLFNNINTSNPFSKLKNPTDDNGEEFNKKSFKLSPKKINVNPIGSSKFSPLAVLRDPVENIPNQSNAENPRTNLEKKDSHLDSFGDGVKSTEFNFGSDGNKSSSNDSLYRVSVEDRLNKLQNIFPSSVGSTVS